MPILHAVLQTCCTCIRAYTKVGERTRTCRWWMQLGFPHYLVCRTQEMMVYHCCTFHQGSQQFLILRYGWKSNGAEVLATEMFWLSYSFWDGKDLPSDQSRKCTVYRWNPCSAQQTKCWIQKDHQWHHIKLIWCYIFMITMTWCADCWLPLLSSDQRFFKLNI